MDSEEAKFTALIQAWLENQSLERTEDYVKAGRRFSKLPLEDLKAQWISKFEAYCKDSSGNTPAKEHEELEAELILRDSEAPYDDERVVAASEVLFKRAKAGHERLNSSPNERDAVNRELLEKIEDFERQTRDDIKH